MLSKATDSIREFLRLESASGILLIAATALALLCANTRASGLYGALLETPVEMRVGDLQIAKPALLWINDGLMAIFFFLIGLELKREVMEGELSRPHQIILPAFAALGGMVIPSGIYALLNWHDPVALRGWAIPAATDIAFALGILALLGSRVPVSLKIFLMSLAIFDDLGAILIVALCYTESLSSGPLLFAGIMMVILFMLNVCRVSRKTPYVLAGLALWVAILKSGVHATLAGVILALFIPMRGKKDDGSSPLCELEHDLHSTVSFGILPLFAFANAGISLKDIPLSSVLHPLPLGIAAGLFLGKQAGVFLFSWIIVRLGLAQLPEKVNWKVLYGVSILCGIGFTMSLFIGSLALEPGGMGDIVDQRIGIMVGSLLSAVGGYLFLRKSLSKGRECAEGTGG